MDPLFTVEDVATALRVKKSWVYERVKMGQIPKVPNMGKHIRFYPSDIKSIFFDRARSLKFEEERKSTGRNNPEEELWHV